MSRQCRLVWAGVRVLTIAVVITLCALGGASTRRPLPQAAAAGTLTPPPARVFASVAYDPANHTVILFGGLDSSLNGVLNDTWIWNGSAWSEAAPSCTPSSTCPAARAAASMAYSANAGPGLGAGLLLFGGDASLGSVLLNDTWFWNGQSWSQLLANGCTSGCPSACFEASMAYDSASDQTLLFGGAPTTGSLNDTWIWNPSAKNWAQQLSPGCTSACTGSPPARSGASMDYDTATSTILLFGGGGSTVDNDTWLWNGSSWFQEIDPGCTSACPGSPPARGSASMATNPTARGVVLFGGQNSSGGALGDTWVWNGVWSQVTDSGLQGAPTPRAAAAMAEDPVTQTAVLFGGADGLGGSASPVPPLRALNDTWLWDGSTWSPTCGLGTTPAAIACVLGISPSFGTPAGGTTVALTGSGFTGALGVSFGQTLATSFTVVSDTEITATAPAGSAGTTVDITVFTTAGTSSATTSDQFTYAIAPTVTAISPANGAPSGGTTVTISGTNFSTTPGAVTVQFGTTQAQIASSGCRASSLRSHGVGCQEEPQSLPGPQPSVLSPLLGREAGGSVRSLLRRQSSVLSPSLSVACASTALCYAISPPGTGTVDVRVTVDGLQNAISAGDMFVYALTPAVGGVAPRAGPTGGGTRVTISGSSFTNATAVSFGGIAATSFSVTNDTTLQATPPGGSKGSVVDVEVTTAAGTSLPSAADSFTYVLGGDANADGVVMRPMRSTFCAKSPPCPAPKPAPSRSWATPT